MCLPECGEDVSPNQGTHMCPPVTVVTPLPWVPVSTQMLCVPIFLQTALEAAWGVPVLDRFTVVLHVFRCNARTREARLQLALAEIPLLRCLPRIPCSTRPPHHPAQVPSQHPLPHPVLRPLQLPGG